MDLATNQPATHQVMTVDVTAYYPTAAQKKTFDTELGQTLRQVVAVAYDKLGQQPRSGGMILCHGGGTDLSLYLDQTLAQIADQGVCIHKRHEHHYELAIDIDAEAGGA